MRRCSTKLQLRWSGRGSCWIGTRGRGRRGGSGSFSSILSLGSTAGTCTCVSLPGGSGGDSRNNHTGGYTSGHPAVVSVSQVASGFRAFSTCETVRSSLFHVASLGVSQWW